MTPRNSPSDDGELSEIVHLRILETTDLHMHIWPFDYYTDQPLENVGLARTATLIHQLRSEAKNSLLFDNGDLLQGNPMGDFLALGKGLKNGDTHPLMAAMNTLGFDGATLGNHDFNYGLEFLKRSLEDADFPFVLANVQISEGQGRGQNTLYPPYVILDRFVLDEAGQSQLLRVGVIGLVPPQIMQWDQRLLEGRVEARDMVKTARAYIPEMRSAGADIIVALAHTGIGQVEAFESMENATIPIAAIDGVDVVLAGHSHLEFPSDHFARSPGIDVGRGLILGKPAVMGGFWGSRLGLIDLWLRKDAGTWRIEKSKSEVRSTDEAKDAPDEKILAVTKPYHDATRRFVRRKVGKTNSALHSYFSLVGHDRASNLIAEAQIWYAKNKLQFSPFAEMPILSAVAPFKAGGRGGPEFYIEIPPGPIALRDLASLYIYPNRIRALVISGFGLRNWLERAAGIFNRISPDTMDQSLHNPDFPSYDFDVVHGVTYQIDLTQPSRFDSDGNLVDPRASRVRKLYHKGKPVADDALFILVTNSFRSGGGGNYPGAVEMPKALEAPDTNQDVLVQYVEAHGQLSPKADAPWSFSPIGRAGVVFKTGPKALRFLDEIIALGLKDNGISADGFLRLRMVL